MNLFKNLSSDLNLIPAGLTQIGGERISFYKCRECGSVIIKQLNENDHLNKDYSDDGKYYKLEVESLKEKRYRINMVDIIENLFENDSLLKLKERKVLEIGYGDGRVLKELHNRLRCKVFGLEQEATRSQVDFSEANLEINDELENSTFINQKFDCIFSIALLEHVKCVKQHIFQLSELVDADGFLVFQYPNVESITAQVGIFLGYWDMLFEPGHITLPSVRGMKKIMNEAGFSIHMIKTCTIRSRGRIPLIAKRNATLEAIIRDLISKYKIFRQLYCLIVDIFDLLLGGETIVIVAKKKI